VDETLSERWETAEKGWVWANLVLDGSWSEETLIQLVDESYDLTLDSLEPEQRRRFDRFRKKKRRRKTLKLNLMSDFVEIREVLVSTFQKYAQKHQDKRTASRHPMVTRVDLVFSLGDSQSTPWVHVDIDTKASGEPDGDPTHRGYAKLSRRNWRQAVKAVFEDEIVAVMMPDGKERKCNNDRLSDCIGKLLIAVLLDARQSGIFEQLPRADRCELGVEDPTTEEFGWPEYKDRGKKNLA
jgi:hypothetical protein